MGNEPDGLTERMDRLEGQVAALTKIVQELQKLEETRRAAARLAAATPSFGKSSGKREFGKKPDRK